MNIRKLPFTNLRRKPGRTAALILDVCVAIRGNKPYTVGYDAKRVSSVDELTSRLNG